MLVQTHAVPALAQEAGERRLARLDRLSPHIKAVHLQQVEGEQEARAFVFAFDLLEMDGLDMRREPIETRKATLASLLRNGKPGVRLNEHIAHSNGAAVFHHACKLGAEGIVSKRLGSHYRSGRSPDWLKFKNPDAPAVKREAEEDCGR